MAELEPELHEGGDDHDHGEREFNAAADHLASLATSGDSSIPASALLQFYGLYKQATAGDCQGDKPSIFNPGARAKWSAWKQLEGTPGSKARRDYVALLRRLQPQWAPPSGADGGAGGRAGGSGSSSGGGGGGMGGPVFSSLASGACEGGVQMDAAGFPLHAAAASGDQDEVERLLSSRAAAVNARDGEGCTALHWAADKGHVSAVLALLRQGADANAQDNDGLTALMYAALAEQQEAAKVLLQHGADPTIQNADGETAKDVAPPSWAFLS